MVARSSLAYNIGPEDPDVSTTRVIEVDPNYL